MVEGSIEARRRRALPLVGALACLVGSAGAAAAQSTADLTRMSLEELLGVEVSTVLRTPQAAGDVAAAVFVLTRDDIRRSGATSLPEVLRLVPGLHVARIDAARYAIGVRGFGDRLSRSMLVLIDGRAVYSPLFAGTYWEAQNVLLEDVDRIEVIRGPGGTLWGANAVNGIISIVTKSASDTSGLVITGGVGTTSWAPLGVRYGAKIGTHGHARAYATGFQRDGQAATGYDGWHMAQSGARADWALPGGRAVTVQGDAYRIGLGQQYAAVSFAPPASTLVERDAGIYGGNVLGRWSAPVGAAGRLQVQSYYDRTRRDERPVAETRDTFDLDVQHTRRWARHTVTAGAGYRVTRGQITAASPAHFAPAQRTDSLFSLLAQDEMVLVPERVRVSVGAKAEHNAISGVEVQPSARVLWTPHGAHRVMASVTRAVRAPSRVESDFSTATLLDPAVPSFARLRPNPDFVPEKLVAYEAGYRVQAGARAYLTVNAFVTQLDDVLSTEVLPAVVEPATPSPRVILPVQFGNGLHGNSHGVELTGDVRPASWLRTTASYSLLRVQLTPDRGSRDLMQERRGEGLSPRHKALAAVSIDLPRGFQGDVMWRYVSALPFSAISGYGTTNVRVARRLRHVELALVGQDLHLARHVEWAAATGANVPVVRRGYVSLTVRP